VIAPCGIDELRGRTNQTEYRAANRPVTTAASADAGEGEETCRVILPVNWIITAPFAAVIVCAVCRVDLQQPGGRGLDDATKPHFTLKSSNIAPK
jgi:hypothetical protein